MQESPRTKPKPNWLRGGVIIKKQENFGQCPKKQKCLKFKFGHLKTDGGGLNFSKMSQL